MKIRPAAVAGYFYPDDPIKLTAQINSYLTQIVAKISANKIFGIISPHAGYQYSGLTAAYAYNLLRDKSIDNVIIISPSHREYFPGCCIYAGDAYRTPLGIVEVNKEMSRVIVGGSKNIFFGENGHKLEHALEVQIPFLQTVLSDFSIIPIVIGDQSKIFVYELAERLAKAMDEKTIIVASSDMSHFYSAIDADRLDSVVEEIINHFDYEGLQTALDEKQCEACGGGPIVSLMKTASMKGYKNSIVLHRSDSGDETGDKSEVVGYLSAVIYGGD
ncbi:MAG TPA: AmmeMemoRadiSam system protein B [Ignavibacteriaceae bacterium]|nr:AmmeMemoRadiSam system protein B [Ignavibacteriaceae bacterium]